MTPPEFPENEAARLGTLRALAVLDTPAEERFDRLTRMAKRLFGVPIALVSLVDSNRQWFKSCVGLPVSETPRDVSFCGHAILADEVFVIPDTLQDDRFRDNPLVTGEPNIRFYAGFPLTVGDGQRIGTFCIIDRAPRTLSAEDRELLADLASMAERELSSAQAATLDPLTGLSNRIGFATLARHAWAASMRTQEPLTLVYLDLDKFRLVNESLGRDAGDRALKAFADSLQASFSEPDVVGRIGGDEFAVLMVNRAGEQAESAVARFKAAWAARKHEVANGPALECSISCVSRTATPERSMEEWLAAADYAMYESKRQRRLFL